MVRPGSARLRPVLPAALAVLVVGNAPLLGATRNGLGHGLPSELAEQTSGRQDLRADIDVLWDLSPALHAVAALNASGRAPAFDALVLVIGPADATVARRRARRVLATRPIDSPPIPQVVVVLASAEPTGPASAHAEAQLRELHRSMPQQPALAVLHVGTDATGGLRDAAATAAAVVAVLRPPAAIPDPVLQNPAADPREVAVDRSLRALHGRTSHLRRAVVMAQTSFEVPYAQLNLVSRGTLRSLAYIGRSSDGLERSLSAEAVRLPGALLIGDARVGSRFDGIPEVHGPAAIRYYVGHPVRSTSGHAIGVLCVLDTDPHEIARGDDVLIRDLALLAEGELAALTGDV